MAGTDEAHRLDGRTPLDETSLRQAFGHFPTGVTIVSFERDGEPHGVTASSFVSVSLEPPLIMVAVARTARTHDLLRGLPFTVNLLSGAQADLARRFAATDDELRRGVAWAPSPTGPRLPEALGHLGCVPWATVPAGDHTLYLGRVLFADGRDGDALGFFRSKFITVAQPPASEPVTALDPSDPYELANGSASNS